MLASSLLDIAYTRIYTILIGKFYGVQELGFYNRADGTKQLPVGVLSSIMSRVAFPIFSAAAHDVAQLRRGVRLALRSMMFLNVPMMLGLTAVAEPLILVIFGEKWLPAAPVMQVLCVGAIFWPLHVINLNVLMALGHSHLFFRLEVVKKIFGSIFLIIGAFYGVMGIAWSQAVFGFIAFLINAHYSHKYLNYGVVNQLRDFLPVTGLSIAMGFFVYWIGTIWQLDSVTLQLCMQVLLGGILFMAIGWVTHLSALQDISHLLKKNKILA